MASKNTIPGEIRQALIDQLSHLVDELDAFRSQIDVIPEPVLTSRPMETELSLVEIYHKLLRFDTEVWIPAMHAVARNKRPRVAPSETAESDPSTRKRDTQIRPVLDQIQAARRDLVTLFKSLPDEAWTREVVIEDEQGDVSTLAYVISQHDASVLHAAALRLHESHLSTRERDVPK